jgi:hypothetical protein
MYSYGIKIDDLYNFYELLCDFILTLKMPGAKEDEDQ